MKTFSEFLDGLLEDVENLDERKIVTRFRGGVRKRKLICGKGMRSVKNQRCIRQMGPERMHRRLGRLAAKRALRRKGSGWKRRANFKRQRSMRRRRATLGHR